jgi:hypothetical protein
VVAHTFPRHPVAITSGIHQCRLNKQQIPNKMDSNSPASQAAGSNDATVQSTHTDPIDPSSVSKAVLPAFSSSQLDLGAAMLECVNMGQSLDHEMRHIVHIPKARERMTVGFEMLSTLHGNLFALFCHSQGISNLDAFYDAANTHRHQQRAIAERAEMARMAGMTLEEFDRKLLETQNKVNNETKS